MEDKTLEKYYEIANKELGIRRNFNEDENIFYLISSIEELIDRESRTIKVNGESRDIETYKIVLNNKIELQEKFNTISVDKEPKEFIGFVTSVLVALASNNFMREFGFDVFSSLFVPVISIFGFYFFTSKVKFKSNTDYINYVSFYELVLEILNKK